MVVEKPYAWEYKFLAYVLKDEFEKLKVRKWDLKYGIFEGSAFSRTPKELIDDISERINEIEKFIDFLKILINTAIKEAIGEPGVPSDLEMMIYTSKRIAAVYERLVGWSLYFKSIHADDIFSKLLDLLYELPKSALNSIDGFVEELFNQITCIPDHDDEVQCKVDLNIVLDEANVAEITAEIERITVLLRQDRII